MAPSSSFASPSASSPACSSQLVQAMLSRVPPASQTLMSAGLLTAADRLRAVKRKAEVDVAALLTEMQQRMQAIESAVLSSVKDLDEAVIQAEQIANKRSKNQHTVGNGRDALDAKLKEQLWAVKHIIHALKSRDGTDGSDEDAYDSNGEDEDELLSDPVLVRMSFALWHNHLSRSSHNDHPLRRHVEVTVLFANHKVYKACMRECSGMHNCDDIEEDIFQAAARKYLKRYENVKDWDWGEDLDYGGGNKMTAWFHNESCPSIHRNKNAVVDLLVDLDADENLITSSRFFSDDSDPARSRPPMCEAAPMRPSVASVARLA
jgi:hypothetical protein